MTPDQIDDIDLQHPANIVKDLRSLVNRVGFRNSWKGSLIAFPPWPSCIFLSVRPRDDRSIPNTSA
jgi:hypothetical protein